MAKSKIFLKKFSILEKVENTVPWTYVLEHIVETFSGKDLQEINQTEFSIGRVIKRKGD